MKSFFPERQLAACPDDDAEMPAGELCANQKNYITLSFENISKLENNLTKGILIS